MVDVVWFVDRLGINGGNRQTWLTLLAKSKVRPTAITLVSLHTLLKGQLLTSYASRKSPTWKSERQLEIKAKMEAVIETMKAKGARVIVLSSPESLAYLDLAPEYATLQKLRGGVYTICGLPAIVILPISAWNSQVSAKDIATANFGLETEEALVNSYTAKDVTPFAGEAASPETESEDDSEGLVADDEEDDDQFFYVPVMVPVGRKFLEFDVAKLSRYLHNTQHRGFLPT